MALTSKKYVTDLGKVYHYLPISVSSDTLSENQINQLTPQAIKDQYIDIPAKDISYCVNPFVIPRRIILTLETTDRIIYEYPIPFDDLDFSAIQAENGIRTVEPWGERLDPGAIVWIIERGI